MRFLREKLKTRLGARAMRWRFASFASAIKEKGVLSGKRIERAEVGTAGEFDALSDDELERALVERIARLG